MTHELNNTEIGQMEEDIKTNHVGGLVSLESYAGSDLNLADWEIVELVDDTLLVEYVDSTEDGKGIQRGGIILPLDMNQAMWRVGRVVLAGPKSRISKGSYIMFPNDKGLKARNINGRRNVVFLSDQRIFGVVQPKPSK